MNFLKDFLKIKKEKSIFAATFILDIIFLGIALLLGRLLLPILRSADNALIENSVIDQAQLANNPELAAQTISAITSFGLKYVLALLGFLVLIYAAFALTRAVVWSILSGKKLSKNIVFAFLRFDSSWFVFWLFLLLFVLVGLKPKIAGYGILVILVWCIHSSLFAHYNLVKSKKAVYSFGQAWKQSFSKLGNILPYYLVAVVMAWLVFILFNLIPLPTNIVFPIELLVFVIYINWFRWYASRSLI